jgi:ribosome maturation factor RimP
VVGWQCGPGQVWRNGGLLEAHFCWETGFAAMSQVSRQQLIDMLEPTVTSLGYELADLELQTGTGGVLRLFIDAEAGITLDDCETVSRQVSALLDVEDPIHGDYSLEVSSPGLNRRLVKAEHFERFAGERVKVKLKRLFEGRRNFKAKLLGYTEPNVILKEGQDQFLIPLDEIDTARIVPKY